MPKRSHDRDGRDEGAVLVVVLVMMVIGALVVVPLLTYTSTVFKASKVQTDKARSVELARGGTWVALNNEAALFDMCDGGTLPSSLAGVMTTCQVLANTTQTPPSEVPYHVAAVQSDVTLPPQLTGGDSYTNPNSTASDPADFDRWLDTPDWSNETELGKVWLPQLPVQSTSSGGTRDTDMIPGAQDPAYASCRVFFPGTFSTPIEIDEPTYFTSGVYYFTEPVTIKSGADVVVGNGAAGGCTTDFEAIAAAQAVPDPLNMSGVGGTFVFGGDARLVFDDSAGNDIRFMMNRRYVSQDEESVLASSGVSIVSVNGTHEPLLPSETLGDDLVVDGVIAVPASTVGTDGDPLATDSSYDPSMLTPKPTEPDAPFNVVATVLRVGDSTWDGAATVTWDVPNENGSLITGYTVIGDRDGVGCSTLATADTPAQNSCTVYGMRNHRVYEFNVVASNDVGDSPVSDASNSVEPHSHSGGSPMITFPDAPENAAVGAVYSDGVEITWDAPVFDGYSPVLYYEVTAWDPSEGEYISCIAWWDETSCVLTESNGFEEDEDHFIWVEAINDWGYGVPADVDGDPTDNALPAPNPEPDPLYVDDFGSTPAPVPAPITASIRMPEPILDVRTTSAADVEVMIDGYVSVPQGHVAVGAAVPSATKLRIAGGMIAAQVVLEPTVPDVFSVWFNNPVAQKRVRLRSTSSDGFTAVSDAIVQINKSGSIAINSWVVQ